jgi:hypothetical protein
MDENVTKEDLQQFGLLLINQIKSIFEKELIQDKDDILSPEWLKGRAVRKLLDISAGSLQNLRISGKVRYRKVLGSYYYNKADLLAMFDKKN